MGRDAELALLRQRALDRDTVERAKKALQASGMSEPEAFAALRRAAMDRRVTLAEVAAELVSGS